MPDFRQAILIYTLILLLRKMQILLLDLPQLTPLRHNHILQITLFPTLLKLSLIPPKIETPAEAPIQGRLIQHHRILDIIARVAHHSHTSIMPRRQLVVVYQLDVGCLD